MHASNRTSRLSVPRWLRTAGVSAALLAAAVAGPLLVGDRPGLTAEYFALDEPWEGRRLHRTVGAPALDDAGRLGQVLLTDVGFSIRWSGWWDVREGGEHRISLDADDGGYVRVDGRIVADSRGRFGPPLEGGTVSLDPGLHRVEIGFFQRHGVYRFAVRWTGPAAEATAAPLPVGDLYSGRPAPVRRVLRGALGSWPRPARQLLGVVLLALAVAGVARPARRAAEASGLADRLGALAAPAWRPVLLLGLFVVTFLLTLPYTGAVRGGDDTAYLYAATFDTENWFANRYAHVYLLKLFTALGGGDPLLGVRLWWSFAFAATVAALAVAAAAVGEGLQLRTLAATLFVLLAQTSLMGLIGNGFADVSAMMFVTLAVAVYLNGYVSPRRRPPARHGWHALAVGALTACAFRSKEVAAVLVLLPLLLLVRDGRFLGGGSRQEVRSIVRRVAYWALGGAGAYLFLMVLDGVIMGDFLLVFDEARLAYLDNLNFPSGVANRGTTNWLEIIRPNAPLAWLWVAVGVAAFVAGVAGRRLELRLLHLLPLAYLGALIAVYIRLPHPFSLRMLIPILPVACLTAGLLLHYAGVDEPPWERVLRPAFLLPVSVLAAGVVFFLVPYRRGELAAADLLPVDLLRRFGWTPENFTAGVLLPIAALVVVSALALVAGRREARVAAAVVLGLVVFGAGFETTRASLSRRHSVQVSDLLTYPWRTFEADLRASGARVVALSPDLKWRYGMTAATESSLAALALGREDMWAGVRRELPIEADAAIASRKVAAEWRRGQPPVVERALVESIRWGPQGVLVLLRPALAAREADRLRGLAFPAGDGEALERSLVDIAGNADPGERRRLLDRLLGSAWIPVREVHGDQLRGVGLSRGGWIGAGRTAGLIVTNQGDVPLTPRFRLAVHGSAGDYPLRVFVDDGAERRTLVFERRDRQGVELAPVPARSSRLVTVWSDATGPAAAGEGERRRGVRVLAPVVAGAGP